MIAPEVRHRQQVAVWRHGVRPSLCWCGTCLRCRKRAWMRAARARLKALIAEHNASQETP